MELIVAAWHSDQYLLLIVLEKWVMMCRKRNFLQKFIFNCSVVNSWKFWIRTKIFLVFIFSKHQDPLVTETLGKIKSEIKISIAGPKSFPKSMERKFIKHFQA